MLQEWFEDHQRDDADTCDMFLQHYGLPTDLLDFTDSAKIATYFAFKDKPDHIGRVGALPLNEETHNALDIIPFSSFALNGLALERPLRQRGWAVRHRPGAPTNLQDKAVCQRLGIRWWTFRKDCRNDRLFADLKDILVSTNDPFANEMRQWLAEFSEITWQPDAAKKVLIDRVNRYL